MRIEFARSGGAGGQNVNKVSTKAKIWWHIGRSKLLDDDQKARVRTVLANRINIEDELLIESQETRSQLDNKELAIERLNRLVSSALVLQKKRVPTGATQGSVTRRLDEKEKRGRLKEQRKKLDQADLTDI